MIRFHPKTAQAPTVISIALLLPAFLPAEDIEGMSQVWRGMDEVWKRYGPTRKSLGIKYGGMPYRGEGAGRLSRSDHCNARKIINYPFFRHSERVFSA